MQNLQPVIHSSGRSRSHLNDNHTRNRRGPSEYASHSEDHADWAQLRSVLFRTARRFTRSDADAEDVVQAALLRALERRSIMPATAHWQAWLMTVMRRVIVDRARKRHPTIHPSCDPEGVPFEEQDPQPSWMQLTCDQVNEALARCHPMLRETYELCCVEQLSHAEVSARLRISPKTVATRVHRARSALRLLLKPLI